MEEAESHYCTTGLRGQLEPLYRASNGAGRPGGFVRHGQCTRALLVAAHVISAQRKPFLHELFTQCAQF